MRNCYRATTGKKGVTMAWSPSPATGATVAARHGNTRTTKSTFTRAGRWSGVDGLTRNPRPCGICTSQPRQRLPKLAPQRCYWRRALACRRSTGRRENSCLKLRPKRLLAKIRRAQKLTAFNSRRSGAPSWFLIGWPRFMSCQRRRFL
jgi:hypothetical protein